MFLKDAHTTIADSWWTFPMERLLALFTAAALVASTGARAQDSLG